MTKENMINFVAANIKDFLPAEYQDAEVNVLSFTKLNKSYTGLSVRKPDSSIVPTVNLDSALRDITDQTQLVKKMEEMVKEIVEHEDPDFDVMRIKDYSVARSNLFIKVSNAEENAEILETIPHLIREDLAITFHVLLENGGDQFVSTPVQNGMLPLWGIDMDTLVADAMESSQRLMPEKICSLAEQLGLMGAFIPGESPLVLVTNVYGMHGAAALFYPNVMEKIADRVAGSYYILPSSCHEFLILPENDCYGTVSDMKEMVTSINATEVSEEDKLSDSVYFYNAGTKEFSKLA